MIQDELSQGAKSTILKAVREGLGLKYHTASPSIVDELDKSGCGDSFGHGSRFVLSSRTIGEIIDILKTAFEVN